MVVFFEIFRFISNIGNGLCLLFLGYILWKKIKAIFSMEKLSLSEIMEWTSDEMGKVFGKVASIFFVVSLFSTLISSTGIHDLIGYHNIELEPSGTYCYYVEASDGEHLYTLPAQVFVEEYEKEEGERTYKCRLYYIKKVYFSNGGYLDFSKSWDVKLNKRAILYDQNDKEWECTLLNEHAYTPQVKESKDTVSFVFTIVCLSAHVFVLVSLFLNRKENKKQESKDATASGKV